MEAWKEELYHHGIKGQHWGVRRFQNEDGTLTKAGEKRYGTNLDVNDTSRRNVAKIRKGEALRRLDNAKAYNPDNHTRIAELQGRVRSAKRAERAAKSYDKGAKLAAKGETQGKIAAKQMLSAGLAYAGSVALTKFMNSRLDAVAAAGKYTAAHQAVAQSIVDIGSWSMVSLSTAYSLKKSVDSQNLRSFNAQRSSGQGTIKRYGSQEYADRVAASKRKKVKE